MDLAAAEPFYTRTARVFCGSTRRFFRGRSVDELHLNLRNPVCSALDGRSGFSLSRLLRRPGTAEKKDAARSGPLHMLQQGADAAGMPETQVFMNLEKSLVIMNS